MKAVTSQENFLHILCLKKHLEHLFFPEYRYSDSKKPYKKSIWRSRLWVKVKKLLVYHVGIIQDAFYASVKSGFHRAQNRIWIWIWFNIFCPIFWCHYILSMLGSFQSRFFINLKVFEENQLVGHVSPSHFHRQIALWLKAIKSNYKIDAFFISNAFFSAQPQLFAYLFLESSFKCCLGVAWYVKCQCYPHIQISQLRATLALWAMG